MAAQKGKSTSRKREQTAQRKSSGATKTSNRSRQSARTGKQGLIDERSRRDIWGVIFIILAVALFIAAIMPTNAVVTSLMSDALHLGLGLGAYLLPIFILAIGVSFIIKQDAQRLPTRVALGLLIIFIALLGLLSLFTPGAQYGSTAHIFLNDNLRAFGGYVGGGIAYAGISLFGQLISIIVLVGVIIAGLIVIGVSISGFIERIKAVAGSRRFASEEDDLPGAPFARFTSGSQGATERVENAPEMAGGRVQSPISRRAHGASAQNRSAAAGSSAAPTIALGGEQEDHRASTAKTIPLADTLPSVEQSEPERPITRKLGKKQADAAPEPKQKPNPALEKIKKMPVLPLATPDPLEGFELPPKEILKRSVSTATQGANEAELSQTAAILQETLEDFGIFAKVVGWVPGPTVTLYKVDLPAGVRVSKVTALSDDIALALAAMGVRIFAPIPGTNFVGIEVPNKKRDSVLLGDVLSEAKGGPLQMAIGKDVDGNCVIGDLAAMPHLLIGGTTGSGKTIAIHSMIVSILLRATPSEVRFILIDPKRVEFMRYNGIPHLYVPVVTEAKEAASALQWGVAEMERRLKVFSKAGASNIGQYNAKVKNGLLEEEGAEQLPYIVVIIDELADLMMNCGKEVEYSISRIAQLARAAGIHLIVATQRPSANVVTGLIKANITNRIALTVATGIDSRVILDSTGAENLVGKGDMLFGRPEYPKPQRLQGCFVSDEETYAVVEFLKDQGEPEYHTEILKTNLITLGSSSPDGSGGAVDDDDPLIWEAAEIVVSNNLGSTSNIQRRLKVGYSRAGRIMDMLEEKGVVGPPNGSKPREVLVDEDELKTLIALESRDE